MCICICLCIYVYFFRFFSLIGTLGYLLITDCFIYLPLFNAFLVSLVSMSKLWPSTQGFYHQVGLYQNEVHSVEGRIEMGDLGLLYTF